MVIAPRDAIVHGDCDELRRAVGQAVAEGSSQIVVDLTDVPFIDSAGLELLCELQTSCIDGGAHLRLTGVNEVCSEILRLTELQSQFQIHDSVEEAARGIH